MTKLPDFLEGAVDLRVQNAPDVDARRLDDIEPAREAARAGMSAIHRRYSWASGHCSRSSDGSFEPCRFTG